MNKTGTLEFGREAFRKNSWAKAYNFLWTVYQETVMEPGDLELLAITSYLIGRDSDCIETWTQAHREYLNRDKPEKAAECAFWAGMVLFNQGERARGNGWFARAHRLLDEIETESLGNGLLLIPEALQQLRTGKPDKAFELFKKAGEIGQRLNSRNLQTLSRLGSGQALIQRQNFEEGKKLLDEAMVAVVAEEISPVVAGIVYCAVIDTCQKIFDLPRAKEWTSALSRWCDAQPDLVPYRGQCLVRRAEIMQIQGKWQDAMTEVQKACELGRKSSPSAVGDAFYCLAELHRLQGDFEKAEETYRQANKQGRKPQPGLALLRLSQGKQDLAESSIRTVEKENKDPVSRSKILPAFIDIMLEGANTDSAETAVRELSQIATEFQSPYLQAITARAQGRLLLIKGEPRVALDKLLHAWSELNKVEAIYEAARTRVLIGYTYLELNDRDTAEMELDAARWIFRQLEAAHDLARANRFSENTQKQHTFGLTPRELEVLRHIATGKTNKTIASDLFISERTVDRHVSNILAKLDLPSRAAATAFAFEHDLIQPGING